MMKGKWTAFGSILLVVLLALAVGWAQAQEPQPPGDVSIQAALGTGFTYQGQLKQSGNPVNGTCDLQFSLYDAASGGTQVGTTQSKTSVAVSNGYFTIPDLDFGSVFTGDARWLAIAVRCPAGSGSYTPLSPRQALTPAPYALALPGLWTQQNGVSPNVIGGYNGNSVTDGRVGATIGGGGASGAINRVTDNYGTVGGGGGNTASGNATVGGGYQNTASGGEATIGGGWLNTASGGFATIGGGYTNTASNYYATVGGGSSNTASGEFTTVSGGRDNTASGESATVGGGVENTAVYTGTTVSGGWNNSASLDYAAVGGGAGNTASGPASTVSGGWSNAASGESASIGGGDYNVAAAAYATIAGGGPWDPGNPTDTNNRVTDDYGTIGGGGGNRAGDGDGDPTTARFATVGGGGANTASGESASVGGGYENTASGGDATVSGGAFNTASGDKAIVGGGYDNAASGEFATVGGGAGNTASGLYATVGGGYVNTASGLYATVGGGYSNEAIEASTTVGGGWNNTASANAATVPGGASNIASGAYSFAAGAHAQATHAGAFVWSSAEATSSWGDNTFTVRSHGGARFYTAPGTGTGVQLASGAGSWSNLSDRAAKENYEPVDGREVLERLAAVPIQTWNYRSQDPAIRHIGPVAQDFYAAFGVGEDDTHISTVDADGVALAAIQGLYDLSQEQAARIAELEGRVAALEAENSTQQLQIDDLEARLAALAGRASGPSAPTSALPVYGLALGGLVVLEVAFWRRKGGGRG